MPKGAPKKDGSGRGRGQSGKVVVGILEKGKKQQIKYSKIAHAVTASIALLD